jgi:endogenous inhibitor of DNA gyrase (YacG/DUF329 family)
MGAPLRRVTQTPSDKGTEASVALRGVANEGETMKHKCPGCGKESEKWCMDYKAEMSCMAVIGEGGSIEHIDTETLCEQSSDDAVISCPECKREVEFDGGSIALMY